MLSQVTNFLVANLALILPAAIVVALVVSRAVRTGAAFLLRVLARLLLLMAVVALVYDGTRTLAGGSGLVITSLAEHIHTVTPKAIEALRGAVVKVAPAAVWDTVLVRILKLPAWALLAALGLLLAWIGRKRQRVRVFVN
jgi:hypothetical protein